jgi:raffinose/stachyose/melibiose transport system permease protein
MKPLHIGKNNRYLKPDLLLLELLTILLFLLFMFPFIMVVLNSAKTSREIIFNAIALPTSWKQLGVNVGLIFSNPTVDYLGAFIDSIVITVLSLLVISIFSSMAAWILVRNKTPGRPSSSWPLFPPWSFPSKS